MSQRNSAIAALVLLLFTMASTTTWARAIRVDSDDWNNSGFLSANSTEQLGFNFQMLGVSASQATISTNGSVVLSGGTGTGTANLNPFFDPAQLGGGNTVQYQFGVTEASFAGNTPGVAAGFRVEWLVFDSSGTLLNEFQLAMFELTSGMLALESNYNQLTFAGVDPQIGYSTSFGDVVDLANTLGLGFADYSGVGDDGFGNNGCPSNPAALACRNYYDGNIGTDVSVLPNTANGFFQDIDSNGNPVQGRYLWLFDGNAAPVPAPATLLLFGLGALLLAARRRA